MGGEQESDWWSTGEAEDGAKYLSSLVSIPTSNRWSVLERQDTERGVDDADSSDTALSSGGCPATSGLVVAAADVALSNVGMSLIPGSLKGCMPRESDGALSTERLPGVVLSGGKGRMSRGSDGALSTERLPGAVFPGRKISFRNKSTLMYLVL